MAQNKRQNEKKIHRVRILIVVLFIAAATAGGIYSWGYIQPSGVHAAAAATPSFRTATVRRGNITLSATGSGTLTASQSSQLGFPTNGTVGKVNVQAGDQVKQGQALAQLDTLEPLQAAVDSAQQDLVSAQQALETYRQSASANLANAQLAVINDKKAATDAQSGLIQPGMVRCDQTTMDAYYYRYTSLKKQLDALGSGTTDQNYYLHTILPLKNQVAQAYAAYQWCGGFTQYEIDGSHAKLALAQSKLAQDQATLDMLQKNNNLDPITLAQDQNKVDSAQLALDTAKSNLEGATIKAPFDGTILSVSGQAGSVSGASAGSGTGASSSANGANAAAGSTGNGNGSASATGSGTGTSAATFSITIADLAHPEVQFAIDETDFEKAAIGEEAQVVFDALPEQTFSGKVVQINPSLVTANNAQTLQGLIQLDLNKQKNMPAMVQGMNATITLIKAQANNVLLVPAQAVHDLGDGTYGVFVVDASGQPKLKVVQVGLQDLTNVEITSGLSAGDVVSTGTAQTNQ